MADELTQFKQDLDELKQRKSHVQIRLEESVSKAKSLKETLSQMGYASLSEAKEAYKVMCGNAQEKHSKVKELIQNIKAVEGRVPTKDEILKRLREESQVVEETKPTLSDSVSVEENKVENLESTSSKEDTPTTNSGTNSTDNVDLNDILFGGL